VQLALAVVELPQRSVEKPRRANMWYMLCTMRLFIVPPCCGCGCRISAKGGVGPSPCT
jgi:hypothetical protein